MESVEWEPPEASEPQLALAPMESFSPCSKICGKQQLSSRRMELAERERDHMAHRDHQRDFPEPEPVELVVLVAQMLFEKHLHPHFLDRHFAPFQASQMSSKDQEEQVFANAPTSTEAELARQSGEALRSIHESFVALPEKPETAHRAAPHHHVFDGLAHETCKVGGPKTLSASWMSGPLPEPCRICRSCRLCFWRHFPSPHRHCHHSWCTDIVEASLGRALRPFAMRE